MAPSRIEDDGFATSIPEVPVTELKPPFMQDADDYRLKDPGTVRATEAASFEAPHGTTKKDYARRNKNKTVLQQHVAFFDFDSDGVVWPLDTFRGFYLLGYGFIMSVISMLVIHLNFSYPTVTTILPDPFCRLYLDRIHKTKHGSDSGTFDTEGRFEPQKFEDIFAKYASGDKQGIYGRELLQHMKAQRVVNDFFGWTAQAFEWLITWLLLWPEDGRMMKEDIRRIYDGSLLYEIAERRQQKKSL